MQIVSPSPDLKSACILVIDDEENVVRPLERIIRRAGYTNVRVHMDAETAVDAFCECRPDLLILDMHMPAISGMEILMALAEQVDGGDQIPIIMITGDHCLTGAAGIP